MSSSDAPALPSTWARFSNTCLTWASKSAGSVPTGRPSPSTATWPETMIRDRAPSTIHPCENPRLSCQVQGFSCVFVNVPSVVFIPLCCDGAEPVVGRVGDEPGAVQAEVHGDVELGRQRCPDHGGIVGVDRQHDSRVREGLVVRTQAD